MIKFDTIIYQFAEQGEKTGWSYIIIPQDLALELKPGNKKSFRVKGFLDHFPIAGVALMPWGDGSFIMAINADMRKGIHKSKGATIAVQLETHDDYVVEMPKTYRIASIMSNPKPLSFSIPCPVATAIILLNGLTAPKQNLPAQPELLIPLMPPLAEWGIRKW